MNWPVFKYRAMAIVLFVAFMTGFMSLAHWLIYDVIPPSIMLVISSNFFVLLGFWGLLSIILEKILFGIGGFANVHLSVEQLRTLKTPSLRELCIPFGCLIMGIVQMSQLLFQSSDLMAAVWIATHTLAAFLGWHLGIYTAKQEFHAILDGKKRITMWDDLLNHDLRR